jgi:hypothetical protein
VNEHAMQERLARLEAALRRSLALLRSGLAEDAQRELAGALAAGEGSGDISELELEAAFEAAQPERERMRDADQVAREAMLASGTHEPELGDAAEDAEEEHRDSRSGLPPSFATATMAELLERQGDVAGASRIRAGLAAARPAPVPAARPSRQQVIATLEGWLHNVQRRRA